MKNDRRIKKTKEAIYSAFSELIEKKELRKISVQELCEAADIHRATFYYHYQDIYDLYEKIEAEVTTEIEAILDEARAQNYQEIYLKIAGAVKEKLPFWQMLLGENAPGNFVRHIEKVLAEKFLAIWQYETGKMEYSPEFRLLLAASVAAFTAVVVNWIKDGCPENNMVDILRDLDDGFDAVLERYL